MARMRMWGADIYSCASRSVSRRTGFEGRAYDPDRSCTEPTVLRDTEHSPPEGLNAPCLHVCMITLASLFMQLDMTAECGCLRTRAGLATVVVPEADIHDLPRKRD